MDNDIKNDVQRSDTSKKSTSVAPSKKGFSKGKNVFSLIVFILLAFSLISVLSGHEVKTFTSLLNTLAEVPQIDPSWLYFEGVVLDAPDWLAPVVDLFADLFGVVGFILAGIVQALTFILYILRWIFL